MRGIKGISHLVVATPDPSVAGHSYERLLDTTALASVDARGRPSRMFELANLSLLLREPEGDEQEGLCRMVFQVDDLARATDTLGRCGVAAGPTTSAGFGEVEWMEQTLELGGTGGLPLAVTERAPPRPHAPIGLDHVVVRTPHPERAVALYGGRLGLDMRLDRSNSAWNARLLFFRCGDLVVEIAHSLQDGVSDAPDWFGGLSWRVPNIADTHARLTADGFDMSPVRTGRRPGSRVCTVRNRTAGVPTILLGVEPRAA